MASDIILFGLITHALTKAGFALTSAEKAVCVFEKEPRSLPYNDGFIQMRESVTVKLDEHERLSCAILALSATAEEKRGVGVTHVLVPEDLKTPDVKAWASIIRTAWNARARLSTCPNSVIEFERRLVAMGFSLTHFSAAKPFRMRRARQSAWDVNTTVTESITLDGETTEDGTLALTHSLAVNNAGPQVYRTTQVTRLDEYDYLTAAADLTLALSRKMNPSPAKP